MSSLLMNIIVLVPYTWPGIHCASRPSFFSYDYPHTLQYLGIFMRCRISISSPVFSSKTVLRIFIGGFLLVILAGGGSQFCCLYTC